jgi:hypothetical protein
VTERLYVGTRKGLFELACGDGTLKVADVHFLSEPVSALLADGQAVYAALDLGHFGAKPWRRDEDGNWTELAVPAFPPKPEDASDDPHP